MNKDNNVKIQPALDLLAQDGIALEKAAVEMLLLYVKLVEEWNESISLVSQGDLEHLIERHVVDSLSLVPIVRKHCPQGGKLMDIGSGAGFPAIPIKIALPDVHLVLVERSDRKMGFLRKAVGDLRLANVTFRHGEFPGVAKGIAADVVTARAVEDPKKLTRAILKTLTAGSVFVCQSGEAKGAKVETFHVEHVDDAWKAQGLRRGEVDVVSRL